MPLSQASPAARASASFGAAPTPISTASHGTAVPSDRRTAATWPCGAFECLHRGVQHDAHTLGRMTALEEIRQRDRRHPGKDARLPLDHHDVGAEDARGRGDLQADIAGADDGDARAWARQGPEAIGIGQRAQCDDARKVVAWHRK